jgi:protein involved in polysaccharide export with SLBB domain
MTSTVRSISDWLRAKLVFFLAPLLLCSTSPLRGQQQTDTPQQQTQQQTNQKIQQLAALASTRPRDVPVGAGDLLHIDVFDVPELSRDVRVSDLGDISYPLIPGKIQAAGLTPFQLEEKMEQLLVENGLVTHPQVSVFVKEQTSQPVSVVGAVAKPGVYQIVRPTTLLELLANAGGITDLAGSAVLVTRGAGLPAARTVSDSTTEKLAQDSQTISIRLQDLLESGDPSFNIQVFGATWSPSREQASYMSWVRESRSRAAMFCRATGNRSAY